MNHVKQFQGIPMSRVRLNDLGMTLVDVLRCARDTDIGPFLLSVDEGFM